MKRVFLVDLENVGKSFTEGIEQLSMEDTLYICHNRTMGSISQAIQDKLYHTKARIKVVEIYNTAKNAMDFCLCTQLGYLIAGNGNWAEYYIVSNDKGFESAMDFVKTLDANIKVRRIQSIHAQQEAIMNQEEERKLLESLLPGINRKVIAITQRCIDSATSKNHYHMLLQKNLYENQVKDVYAKTKHLLATA